MNLILLTSQDFDPLTGIVRLTGRRLCHVLEVLKPVPGDSLCVGLLDEGTAGARPPAQGLMGTGRVVAISDKVLELDVRLEALPPPKVPVILAVALMRPVVLKRVLSTAASMGVGRIMVFHCQRVEKSFWQSTALKEDAVREQLFLGLEQARDTVLPQVSFHKKFKPWVEDVLPGLLRPEKSRSSSRGLVADPSGCPLKGMLPGAGTGRTRSRKEDVIIIGPEGGFIPYEIGKFREAGCCVVSLGQRILKVETAIVSLLAKLS
jgi:RsmE family RNA methyltransferase